MSAIIHTFHYFVLSLCADTIILVEVTYFDIA